MEKNNIEIEAQKLKNAMDFYLLANNLKYQIRNNHRQSIADQIYGTMILAIAFYSEYGIINDLGTVLRIILLKEMQLNNKNQFDICLSKLSKGNNYVKELEMNSEFWEFNTEIGNFIEFCKSLDNNLSIFFNEFLIFNKVNTDDYRELYQLAKETGYFVSLENDDKKNLEIFRFYYLNNKLKNKIRSGWDSHHWNINYNRIERISEHVVGTIALAIALDSEFNFEIDIDKVISTLCIHEVGEIKIGDITPFDNITPEQKQKIEHEAIIDVIGNLTKNQEMINSIFEFDDKKTNNAKFSHYCDKLEADIQSKIYQDMGCHHSIIEQENNVVFKNIKVRKMIEEGAVVPFDIWYNWDKDIYKDSPTFTKVLKYAKNNKLK